MVIEDDLPAILDTFSGVAAKIRRLFSGISLIEPPNENGILLLSFSALFANFVACISLLRARNFLSLSLVLRPVLEASADIKNISTVPGYIDRMRCSSDKQYCSYLKGMARLKRVPGYVDKDLPKYERNVASYTQRGIKPLNVREKFAISGMGDEYIAIYSMLSGALHNDYNLTLKKVPNYYENFAELHERQSRAHELLLGNLLVMHSAISTSVETVSQKLGTQNTELYASLSSELQAVKERLYLLNVLNSTVPQEPTA